ncbi:hypothetical protein CORC01_11786, partial [Colletotrichum orchidophilum]
ADRRSELGNVSPVVDRSGYRCSKGRSYSRPAGCTSGSAGEPLTCCRRCQGRVVCANCDEKFDVDENGPNACYYSLQYFNRDGSLEIWDQIDKPDKFYGMDSDEAGTDIPDSFRWSCCQRVGNVEGCQNGGNTWSYWNTAL